MNPLRPYQVSTRDAVHQHWRAGRRRVLVCKPTGAGKTETAASLQPDLAIVHTDTLRTHTRRRIPNCTTTTVQTLLRAGRPVTARRVFIDEAHHIASPAWARLMMLLPRDCAIVGMTATPARADGVGMGNLFDALVAPVNYTTLLRGGFLAQCDVDTTVMGMDPVDAYLGSAAARGRPGIFFLPTIPDCDAAVARLWSSGIRAGAIHSEMTARLRVATVAAFDAGHLDVLASPRALAEGFDSPRAKVCVLNHQCVHVGTYLQEVNRVTRWYRGERALLLDCTGASLRHGHPLEDRVYSLDGAPIRRAVVAPAAPGPRHASGVRLRERAQPAAGGLEGTLDSWGRAVGGWLQRLFQAA
jgi:DNA repair protein RadD